MQRTVKQNSSMWVSSDLLAAKLNDAGLNITAVIERGLLKNDVPWTQQSIIEVIVRPIMSALWPVGPPDDNGKIVEWKNPDRPSTTQLSTAQIQYVWDIVNQAVSTKFGISAVWASEDSLRDEHSDKQQRG